MVYVTLNQRTNFHKFLPKDDVIVETITKWKLVKIKYLLHNSLYQMNAKY